MDSSDASLMVDLDTVMHFSSKKLNIVLLSDVNM